jgi:hypothetical protein
MVSINWIALKILILIFFRLIEREDSRYWAKMGLNSYSQAIYILTYLDFSIWKL